MGEDIEKNEILKSMIDVEYYPSVQEDELSMKGYRKIPLAEVSALGVAFKPLTSIFQKITKTGAEDGKSGIYRVTIPEGRNVHLAKFRDGSGFTATGMNEKGIVGQARLNSISFNPTMLFMAVALKSIDNKLDAIQKSQEEIIDFLEQKEKSKLRGNHNVLIDVLNNYKYNWNNEKYKTNKHIQVQEIKRDSEHSVIFYREQIIKEIKKRSFIHRNKHVENKLEKVQSMFEEYQLALYLFSFSSFLEVMLLENFESAYLKSIALSIEENSYQYRELYTESYNRIENDSKTSINANLSSGLGSINKFVGKTAEKVSIIKKARIDENLVKISERLEKSSSKKTVEAMRKFVKNQSSHVRPFVENINTINRLYNKPVELLFDQENIYFSLSKE